MRWLQKAETVDKVTLVTFDDYDLCLSSGLAVSIPVIGAEKVADGAGAACSMLGASCSRNRLRLLGKNQRSPKL